MLCNNHCIKLLCEQKTTLNLAVCHFFANFACLKCPYASGDQYQLQNYNWYDNMDDFNDSIKTGYGSDLMGTHSHSIYIRKKSQGASLASTIKAITPHSWIFLILSGLATGASWLCYFYALKIGDASKVVPVDKCSLVLTIIFAVIFLGETLTWKTVVGCVLLLAGTFIIII